MRQIVGHILPYPQRNYGVRTHRQQRTCGNCLPALHRRSGNFVVGQQNLRHKRTQKRFRSRLVAFGKKGNSRFGARRKRIFQPKRRLHHPQKHSSRCRRTEQPRATDTKRRNGNYNRRHISPQSGCHRILGQHIRCAQPQQDKRVRRRESYSKESVRRRKPRRYRVYRARHRLRQQPLRPRPNGTGIQSRRFALRADRKRERKIHCGIAKRQHSVRIRRHDRTQTRQRRANLYVRRRNNRFLHRP